MSSGMSMMYGLSSKYVRLSTNARQTSAVQPPAIAGTPKPGCSTCAGKRRRITPAPAPAPAPPPPEPIALLVSAPEPIPSIETFTEESFQTPYIQPEDDTYFHEQITLEYPLMNSFHTIFQEKVWNTPEDFLQVSLSFDQTQMIQSPFTASNPYTLPHATFELFIRDTLQLFGWSVRTQAYISGVPRPTFTPSTSPMSILLRDTSSSSSVGEISLMTYDTETRIWRYHGNQEYPLIVDPNVYLEALDPSILVIYIYDN
jgi:hypothetical protein